MTPADIAFLQELRQDFLLEAREHLHTITSGLLELEKTEEPSEKLVETIYRAAHSLKGAAHAVDMPKVAYLCQSIEGVFSSLKDNTLILRKNDYDLLQRSMDSLSTLVEDADSDDRESRSLAKTLDALKSGPSKDIDLSLAEEIIEIKPQNREATSCPEDQIKVVETDTVRVKSAKVDSLLLQAEEMISVNLAIDQRLSEAHDLLFTLKDCKRALNVNDEQSFKVSLQSLENSVERIVKSLSLDGKAARSLLDRLLKDAKSVIMLPSSTLLQSFPKMVRDTSRTMGKDVDFHVEGGDVEVDKRILEGMKDPLIHLIRNALDHGVEKPEERIASGKPPKASLKLSFAYSEGGQLDIEITDDGRGLDTDKIKKKAISSGILSEGEALSMEEGEVFNLVFRSGFSTTQLITDISGRGLGMAIVRENVESLGGTIVPHSTEGKGTTFKIRLPLSMATFRGVLVKEWERFFILPTSRVIKVTQIQDDQVRYLEGRETITLDGSTYPLVRLGTVLSLNPPERYETPHRFPVVIASSGPLSFAFAVQSVLGEQEILLKGLGPQLIKVPFVSGATVMGSGKVVPVLRIKDLLQRATEIGTPFLIEKIEKKTLSVLLVEDSITSRTLLKNILTASGYRVETAVDGQEGLDIFNRESFDIVVSDVEMPRMNGFELTKAIRSNLTKGALPVILVTSLDTQKDKEMGVEAGADAYIVKSSFDQGNLLEVMRRLL